MPELDQPVSKLQRVGLERGGKPALRASCRPEGRLDRGPRRARESKAREHSLPGSCRKHRQPLGHELAEAARDRQLSGGAGHLAVEGAEDLEREERVPAGRSQEPGKRRPGQGDAETFPDELVKGAEAEGLNLETRDFLLRAELPEPERRLCPLASGHEQPNALVLQAPDRIRDDSRRRRVQPLDVVDCNQDRG